MIILLYMIIKQKERKRERKRKKEIQQLVTGTVHLKGHLCTLFTEKKFHSCTYWYSKVLMCTFLSISYKDVFIRVLFFTYFKLYFVYVVCTVHGTQ